jgi:hypothetical protein
MNKINFKSNTTKWTIVVFLYFSKIEPPYFAFILKHDLFVHLLLINKIRFMPFGLGLFNIPTKITKYFFVFSSYGPI